jgi:hypothetical protein
MMIETNIVTALRVCFFISLLLARFGQWSQMWGFATDVFNWLGSKQFPQTARRAFQSISIQLATIFQGERRIAPRIIASGVPQRSAGVARLPRDDRNCLIENGMSFCERPWRVRAPHAPRAFKLYPFG